MDQLRRGEYYDTLCDYSYKVSYWVEMVEDIIMKFSMNKICSSKIPLVGKVFTCIVLLWKVRFSFLQLVLHFLPQVEARAVCLGAGLSHIGIPTGPQTNIGLYSSNSVDVSSELFPVM